MLPVRHRENEEAHDNEPEEIREITKKALHARLNNEYYIPENNSRGVNRAYLVGVFTGNHFRIPLLDFKRFEAELTPNMKKKTPMLNGIDALTKLNRLLVETGRHELGFVQGLFPDETWFFDVARFVDRANVAALFLASLPGAPPPDCLTSRMTAAKRAAENYLMADRDLLGKPIVFNKVKDIWEGQKKLIARRNELETLVVQGRSVQVKVHEEEAALNTEVMQASMAIFTYGNNMDNPDQIFHEEDGNAHRLQINQISQM